MFVLSSNNDLLFISFHIQSYPYLFSDHFYLSKSDCDNLTKPGLDVDRMRPSNIISNGLTLSELWWKRIWALKIIIRAFFNPWCWNYRMGQEKPHECRQGGSYTTWIRYLEIKARNTNLSPKHEYNVNAQKSRWNC